MNSIPLRAATVSATLPLRSPLRMPLRCATRAATVRDTHLYTTYISPPPFERLGGHYFERVCVTALRRRVASHRTVSRNISQRYFGSFPVGAVWGFAEVPAFHSFRFFRNRDSKVQHA